MNSIYIKLIAFWILVVVALSAYYYRDKYLDAKLSIEVMKAAAIAETARLNGRIEDADKRIAELQKQRNKPIDTKKRRDFE